MEAGGLADGGEHSFDRVEDCAIVRERLDGHFVVRKVRFPQRPQGFVAGPEHSSEREEGMTR